MWSDAEFMLIHGTRPIMASCAELLERDIRVIISGTQWRGLSTNMVGPVNDPVKNDSRLPLPLTMKLYRSFTPPSRDCY